MMPIDNYFQLNKSLGEVEQIFVDRQALEAAIDIEEYELYYSIDMSLITEQPTNA
jgi:hypothetical protein